MDDALLDDPWIAAQIEAAVAPYAGRLPERELAWMRRQLAEVLARDPAAARLLRRAKPRQVDESGEQAHLAPGEAGGAGGRTKAG